MMFFLRSRQRTIILIGIICVVILIGILMTNGLEKGVNVEAKGNTGTQTGEYKTAQLFKNKTPYTGANVKVGNIIKNMPFSNYSKEGFSLKTDSKPYGVLIKYDLRLSNLSMDEIEVILRRNAIVMFALIDNLDEVSFTYNTLIGERKQQHKREEFNEYYSNGLKAFSKDEKALESLINSFSLEDFQKPQTQKPGTVEEAVSLAIKGQSKGYGAGELSVEGHLILDTEEKDEKIKVYTIASFGAFGFENGIFTKVSGSGAVSTVMTFLKDKNGGYSLLEYREPMDGSYNLKSKKEMFPKKLWDKVISEHKFYPDLAIQQEEQAKVYLKSIGRNAKVSEKHVEKKLPQINVEASNKIFSEFMKYDSELNIFPYWLGTREIIEKGTRYIYETSQSKSEDGHDIISFVKKREDGTVAREYKYKIIGSEINLLGQKSAFTAAEADKNLKNRK